MRDLLAELQTELGPPDEAMMADAKALFDAVAGTESKRRPRSGHRS